MSNYLISYDQLQAGRWRYTCLVLDRQAARRTLQSLRNARKRGTVKVARVVPVPVYN